MKNYDLVIDVGNTRTKLALFQGNRVMHFAHSANGDNNAIRTFLRSEQLQGIVIGSVGKDKRSYVDHLRTIAPVLEVSGSTPWPLKNTYGTPGTLGVDRMANALGGVRHFPGRPVLAIDLGSCITYDLVEADGTFIGGAISPGMVMRSKAMNEHSAHLPKVALEILPHAIGTTTESSLQAGIYFGILAELEHFIGLHRHERPQIAVMLTGGDAPRFVSALKNGIFALPFLTLEGLHAILIHNRTLRTTVSTSA